MIDYSQTVPLSEAKARLSDLIRRVKEEHESFTITHRGKAEGVLVSVDEYQSLIETLEILSDRDLLASIERGVKDEKRGRLYPHAEVFRQK